MLQRALTSRSRYVTQRRKHRNNARRKYASEMSFSAFKALQKETNFGIAELQSMRNMYKRHANGQHQMDKKDFAAAMSSLGIKSLSAVAEGAFNAFDRDNNGFVDFREFAAGMSVLTRGSDEDKYAFAFDMWANEDGRLNRDETRKFIECTQHAEMDDVTFENLFCSIDSNGDGAVTLAECKRGIAKSQLVSTSEPEDESLTGFTSSEKKVLSILWEGSTKSKGDTIVTQNQEKDADVLYYVSKGSVQLTRNDVVVETVEEGHFFGEECMFVSKYATGAVANTDVVLQCINTSDLLPLLLHSHEGVVKLVERFRKDCSQRFHNITMLGIKHEALRADEELTSITNKLMTQLALTYHSLGAKGKLGITTTKQVGSAEDLSIAYSPGVAEPCIAIKNTPDLAYEYTAKSHLVGVVSNGTAVLGLGNIGALASKPVMEGKAVLFKKFGGLDSFDIEVNANDPQAFVDICSSLEPTFGGINIEDVKAPECFWIEKEVQKRCKIPIMHDDQHGTAIIAGAGLLNALKLVNKKIEEIKVVVCGVGAAGFTCARYFVSLGVKKENLFCVDVNGVIYKGRDDLTPDSYLQEVAQETDKRTLAEVVQGADVFLGCSAGGLMKPEMLKTMNDNPLVFALANPRPEISVPRARQTRSDVIMATGRSDFPNQINNVCAFPYIFRGAIDARATEINEDIKRAATNAIAKLAQDGDQPFGPDYIIPKPFDPRLKIEVSSAVAQAAKDSGVATKELDIKEYRHMLREEKV